MQNLTYTELENQIHFHTSEDDYTIQFLSNTSFRVCKTSDLNHTSFAIETLPTYISDFQVQAFSSHISIRTTHLEIQVFDDFLMDVYNSNGYLLCSDYRQKRTLPKNLSEEELRLIAKEGHAISETSSDHPIQIVKTLDEKDVFYGLGDKTGYLNKRGYDYVMWNTDNPDPQLEIPTFKSMYKSIPFFITHKEQGNYGIFFDNPTRTYFDMGYENNNYYFFAADKGPYDYYFFAGDSIKEVIAGYTSLTGRTPLPQLWTLGYHQSRWSYMSAKEIYSLAEDFRKHDIPCDCIHTDIDYMEDYKVFTWNESLFDNPSHFTSKLGKDGFKIVSIIDPGVKVEPGYFVYDEGIQNNYFATTKEGDVYENVVWPGDSVFPAFTNETVRTWWAGKQKILLEKGIAGIWNDMNEPASFRGPLPDDVQFKGDKQHNWNHDEIHNVYGHLMAKATYEGIKKYSQKRPFIITRACYSGTNKYSTAWTGDNQSIWAHLQMAIPQLCNLGMSGMTFIGTDIGGFDGNVTKELLCRWIQVGCFSPLFRNHSAKQSRRQEPFTFDEETVDIYRKFVKLRYKLIPYFYDLFYEQTQTGLPIIRPLVLHYESDPLVSECNSSFLVGEQILVAPILYQGETYRMVYLPEGNWIDYETHKEYTGGQHILYHAPLDTCPIFIKAGSILPVYPEQNYIGEKEITDMCFEIYSSSKNPVASEYIHYLDNGTDFSYKNGEYALYKISLDTNDTVTIETTYDNYKKSYNHMDYKLIKGI